MMTDATPTTTDAFETLLTATETRVKHSQHAHWYATNVFDRLARWTTIANILGGALVSVLSTAIFAFEELLKAYNDSVVLLLFLAGAGVSIVSILQSVMRWSERSQSHFIAANAYSSLRRELEILRLNAVRDPAALQTVIQKLANISEVSPAVPQSLWQRAWRQG
ncbi:hypothetical protein [Asticcacaulis sp. AND118]|uniref:hypothetical protein n=1 Tax=Asticcacaulis sp. AND118 TaxID=2840468 RepID=UPI001CFF655C|nr:hypothetical protein [Asticcacaulis sp. AND118]UDF05440.1 hypothetical protein LH365_14630 [Asticcacaulis sp. AND118]